MDNNISVLSITINEIPTLICYEGKIKKQSKTPIILLHKLLQDKESELPLAYHLAINGYFVVIPDLPNHGERVSSFRYKKKLDFNKLFTGINDSVNEINDIINFLKTRFDKQINYHFNVVGISYGGMLALTSGYLLNEVKNIVSINNSVCWRVLIENGSFETFRFFSNNKPVVDIKKVEKVIDYYDPYLNVEKFNMKSVLLINGALDTTFRPVLVQQFYDKIYSYYRENKSAEKITWLKYQKAGHQLIYDMIVDLIIWLKKWNK